MSASPKALSEETAVKIAPTAIQFHLDKFLSRTVPPPPVLPGKIPLVYGRDYSREGLVMVANHLVNNFFGEDVEYVHFENTLRSMALRLKPETNEVEFDLRLGENPLMIAAREFEQVRHSIPVLSVRAFLLDNYAYFSRLLRGSEVHIADLLNGKYQYLYFGFNVLTTTIKLAKPSAAVSMEVPYYQSLSKA